MKNNRPDVPAILELLASAYERLLAREQPEEEERIRLLGVLSDFRWYSQRIGARRWNISPCPDKWCLADILWHVTEQAAQAAEEDRPNSVRYFIDHGKEHVGQTAELWFLLEG